MTIQEFNTALRAIKTAVNNEPYTPVLRLALSIRDITLDKDNNMVLYFFNDIDGKSIPSFRVILTEPKVVTAKHVEKALLLLLTRRNYNSSMVATCGRYTIHVDSLPVSLIETMLQYILKSTSTRTNYSWVQPLQDLLFTKMDAKKAPKQKLVLPKNARRGAKPEPKKSRPVDPFEYSPSISTKTIWFDSGSIKGYSGIINGTIPARAVEAAKKALEQEFLAGMDAVEVKDSTW